LDNNNNNNKSGRADKCDVFGNSSLHYAVRGRSLCCVRLLLAFEPRLIWMMDNNNLTARDLADMLEYKDVSQLLDDFYNEQMKLDIKVLKKFQMKELECANKRRVKYEKQMKNARKQQIDEYKKKKLHEFEFGSKTYVAFDAIVLDDNITLSRGGTSYSASSSSTSTSISTSSSSSSTSSSSSSCSSSTSTSSSLSSSSQINITAAKQESNTSEPILIGYQSKNLHTRSNSEIITRASSLFTSRS
jgi:hypothetical protein